LTYAVRIALVEEFGSGCPDETMDPCLSLLENIDADPDETWWCVVVFLSKAHLLQGVVLTFVLHSFALLAGTGWSWLLFLLSSVSAPLLFCNRKLLSFFEQHRNGLFASMYCIFYNLNASYSNDLSIHCYSLHVEVCFTVYMRDVVGSAETVLSRVYGVCSPDAW
jgi:hypothetical protein